MTKERRESLIKTLDGCKNAAGKLPSDVILAKELVDVCCFDLSIRNEHGETFLDFSTEAGELTIQCFGDVYRIQGKSYTQHPGRITSWKINERYSTTELYDVINEIKLFHMGSPKNSVLFTGAFCPPHIGHRGLIEQSINDGYDFAVIAVSSQEFVEKKFRNKKDTSGIIYTENQRIGMMLAMTYDIPNVLIYGAERGYTYEVLNDVKRKYNITNLSFACGSDKLDEVDHWGYHEKLLNEFGFYVLQRGDDREDEIIKKCNTLFNRYKIVKKGPKYYDVSSSQIRSCMKDGRDYSGLITEKVAEFIKNF